MLIIKNQGFKRQYKQTDVEVDLQEGVVQQLASSVVHKATHPTVSKPLTPESQSIIAKYSAKRRPQSGSAKRRPQSGKVSQNVNNLIGQGDAIAIQDLVRKLNGK